MGQGVVARCRVHHTQVMQGAGFERAHADFARQCQRGFGRTQRRGMLAECPFNQPQVLQHDGFTAPETAGAQQRQRFVRQSHRCGVLAHFAVCFCAVDQRHRVLHRLLAVRKHLRGLCAVQTRGREVTRRQQRTAQVVEQHRLARAVADLARDAERGFVVRCSLRMACARLGHHAQVVVDVELLAQVADRAAGRQRLRQPAVRCGVVAAVPMQQAGLRQGVRFAARVALCARQVQGLRQRCIGGSRLAACDQRARFQQQRFDAQFVAGAAAVAGLGVQRGADGTCCCQRRRVITRRQLKLGAPCLPTGLRVLCRRWQRQQLHQRHQRLQLGQISTLQVVAALQLVDRFALHADRKARGHLAGWQPTQRAVVVGQRFIVGKSGCRLFASAAQPGGGFCAPLGTLEVVGQQRRQQVQPVGMLPFEVARVLSVQQHARVMRDAFVADFQRHQVLEEMAGFGAWAAAVAVGFIHRCETQPRQLAQIGTHHVEAAQCWTVTLQVGGAKNAADHTGGFQFALQRQQQPVQPAQHQAVQAAR